MFCGLNLPSLPLRIKMYFGAVDPFGCTVFLICCVDKCYAVFDVLELLRISSIKRSISFSVGMSMTPTAVK